MTNTTFKCPNPQCNYENNTSCELGESNVKKCKYWKEAASEDKSLKKTIETDTFRVAWNGNSLGHNDLAIVSERAKPILVGVVGPSKSGKTTFLGSLFNLLHAGKKIGNREFGGSYSLGGWEHVSTPMQFHTPDDFFFPVRTSAGEERLQALLHLCMKSKSTGEFQDFLFTDVSGEWFTRWVEKASHEGAKGARWIIKHADCFLFFIDIKGMKGKERGFTKDIISQIAFQMQTELNGRPVGIVLAKYDEFEPENANLTNVLIKEVERAFSNSKQFKVTAKPSEKPDSQHLNILDSIDWLITNSKVRHQVKLTRPVFAPQDYFLSYGSKK